MVGFTREERGHQGRETERTGLDRWGSEDQLIGK